jgi:hypothetical protein
MKAAWGTFLPLFRRNRPLQCLYPDRREMRRIVRLSIAARLPTRRCMRRPCLACGAEVDEPATPPAPPSDVRSFRCD